MLNNNLISNEAEKVMQKHDDFSDIELWKDKYIIKESLSEESLSEEELEKAIKKKERWERFLKQQEIVKARRQTQNTYTIELKVQKNKLSKEKQDKLKSFFVLSKDYYNYIISTSKEIYDTEEKEEIIEEKVDQKKTTKLLKLWKLKKWEKVYFKKLKKVIKEKPWYYKKVKDNYDKLKKVRQVTSFSWNKETEELEPTIKDISILPAQIKSEIVKRTKDSIKGMSVTKSKWKKVWKLKFKSKVTSLPLLQYWNSHKIVNQDTFYIAKLWDLKVSWLKQLSWYSDIELWNARLIYKWSDNYIHLTFFVPKSWTSQISWWVEYKWDHLWNKEIGIDFWIKSQLTLSNWVKFNFQVWESKRTKKLQKKLSKKKKRSKNKFKTQTKLQKTHLKDVNRRKEISNKILRYLKSFDKVVIQDEMIKAWHSNWGKSKSSSFGRWAMSKKVQYSWIWGIIGKIKLLPTHEMIKRLEKTTQTCSCCWNQQKLQLWDRVFICNECWVEIDRDLNSTFNILQIWLKKQIPAEHRKYTPLEITTSMLLESKSISQIIELLVDKTVSGWSLN